MGCSIRITKTTELKLVFGGDERELGDSLSQTDGAISTADKTESNEKCQEKV